MSTITVLGAVGGLHTLFLLALIVTKRHDVQANAEFASPPTHVRVMHDDPNDPRRAAQLEEQMTFLAGAT